MTRKTGVALLALLLVSTLIGTEAASADATRTTASSPTTAHAGSEASSSLHPGSARQIKVPLLGPCRGAHILPTRSDLVLIAAATTCLIDHERVHHGLRTLQPNSDLRKVAVEQAGEMVLGEYFGDDSMSGLTPMQRIEVTHYAWRIHSLSTGQNIGWGTGPMATPMAMVEGWMHSSAHRQIILNPAYRDIGTGIDPSAPPNLAEGMPGATYVVEFGARD